MIILGIDPGADCGIVALNLPGSWRLDAAQWLGSAVVTRTTGTMSAENDRTFRRRIADVVARSRPHVAVIECPIDARPYWQVKTGFADKHKRRESPETRFLQGKHYDAAVQAVPDDVPLHAYPVKGRKGLPGWMGKRDRKIVLAQMRALSKHLSASHELSEHELMALGVIVHHVGLQPQVRCA